MAVRNSTVAKEIRAISVALRQLQKSFDRISGTLASSGSMRATPARRKLRLTPARKAALKLQGQYMGYLRGLAPTQKSKVKKIRVDKGIRAAIAAARRFSS